MPFSSCIKYAFDVLAFWFKPQSFSFADPVVIVSTAASSRVEGEDQAYEVTLTAQTAFIIPFQLTLNFVNGTATGAVCVCDTHCQLVCYV